MPEQPETTDPVERIVQAIEALPEPIGEQVGNKLRQERVLAEEGERGVRTGSQNRDYERRTKQAISV